MHVSISLQDLSQLLRTLHRDEPNNLVNVSEKILEAVVFSALDIQGEVINYFRDAKLPEQVRDAYLF